MSVFNRRDFLNLVASSAVSSLIPNFLESIHLPDTFLYSMDLEQLPEYIQDVLKLVPKTEIGEDGYLQLVNRENGNLRNVRSRRTDWNIERTMPYDQLIADKPWGIVLHWFGDQYNEQQSLDFYLHGFNGKRWFDDVYTSTSAHFLVGDYPPTHDPVASAFGIVQTQKPGPEGIPYQAAHIGPIDYSAYESGRNYFVSALNKLSLEYPGVRTLLQEFYARPGVLAHLQTIAIEITGHHFDHPDHYPSPQKIANVVSVVWSVMKRYKIQSKDIMGHFELQLNKADPGKKFVALIKFLIGIKGLIDDDEEMKTLIFSEFNLEGSPQEQILAYFNFLRDYLLLTTSPVQIYEWDIWSKYHFAYEVIQGNQSQPFLARGFTYPIKEPYGLPGNRFLEPSNHAGVDIYPEQRELNGYQEERNVYLIANGVCTYIWETNNPHEGTLVVFKHRQVDGSEIVSYYGHLKNTRKLKVGEKYRAGEIIGTISTPLHPPYGYLHFSLAYGPSWEGYLHHHPVVPLNVDYVWIENYFLDPLKFLAEGPALETRYPKTKKTQQEIKYQLRVSRKRP